MEKVKVKVDEKEHLVTICKYCAPLWVRPNNFSQKQIVFGCDTEQAFKKRRVTFSEHEQRETHEIKNEVCSCGRETPTCGDWEDIWFCNSY